MEITYLIIGCFAGGIIGAVIVYFVLKSNTVSRKSFDDLNKSNIQNKTNLDNLYIKIDEFKQIIATEKDKNLQQSDHLDDLKTEFSKISTENNFLQNQNIQLEKISAERQQLFIKNSELSAQNETLNQSLENQKEEIKKIQEEGKLQFENLAIKF